MGAFCVCLAKKKPKLREAFVGRWKPCKWYVKKPDGINSRVLGVDSRICFIHAIRWSEGKAPVLRIL